MIDKSTREFLMYYRLSFFFMIVLFTPRAWALEPISEINDPYSLDTISKSLSSQVESDIEDPVKFVCSQVEAIIKEADKMTLIPDENNLIPDKN
jgi:hypothetical protein